MIEIIFPAVVGLLSGAIAAFFSHILLLKKIRKESEEKLRFDLYNKQLDAYEKFWKLLGPTSQFYSKDSQERLLKKNDIGFYIDKDAVNDFFDSFHEYFYSESGLYISIELRSAVFKSRNYYFEFIDEESSEKCINISNSKAKKFFRLWDSVRIIARNDVGLRDVDFPKLTASSV